MSDIPTLLPLEYCTIERAAKMLRCEVEDIKHWIAIESIKGCFILNPVKNTEQTYKATVHPLYEHHFDDNVPRNLLGENCTFEMVAPCYDDEENKRLSHIEGYPSGIWTLGDPEQVLQAIDLKVSVKPIYPLEIEDSKHSISIEICERPNNLPEMVILKEDLYKLHHAIYDSKHEPNLLSNIMNSSEKSEQKKKSREDSPQFDWIVSLILSHPKLGKSVIETPSKALEVLTIQFGSDNTPFTEISPKTMARWIQRSKINVQDT